MSHQPGAGTNSDVRWVSEQAIVAFFAQRPKTKKLPVKRELIILQKTIDRKYLVQRFAGHLSEVSLKLAFCGGNFTGPGVESAGLVQSTSK